MEGCYEALTFVVGFGALRDLHSVGIIIYILQDEVNLLAKEEFSIKGEANEVLLHVGQEMGHTEPSRTVRRTDNRKGVAKQDDRLDAPVRAPASQMRNPVKSAVIGPVSHSLCPALG
ncbi:hypothetical protein NDU88_002684 [Pleurodeles waltl]|uniref:Uncharacterized protein n=1 Tax=Pleurodeles waltl TaxID=8319 RepID=A0AAV7M1A8_PLEWA|nr:hypothetical protein NDU88_002684 [Pleurodeles waltl]